MRSYRVWLTDRTVVVRADGFEFGKGGYIFTVGGKPVGFFHRDSVHGLCALAHHDDEYPDPAPDPEPR